MDSQNLTHVEDLAQKYAIDIDFLETYLSGIVDEQGNFESASDQYFWERILGIVQENGRDIWVSRWELKGLLPRLESNGYIFRGPESHIGGICGLSISHYNLTGRDVYETRFKKHLFITEDPNDLRLSRFEVYHPNHPSE